MYIHVEAVAMTNVLSHLSLYHAVRSRSLLSLDTAHTTFPQAVCDWFRYAFLPDKHIHDQHTESPPDHKPGPVHTWPDIYLSSYTPLTVHTNNDSHSRAAVAA